MKKQRKRTLIESLKATKDFYAEKGEDNGQFDLTIRALWLMGKEYEDKYYYSINQYAALYVKADGKIGTSKQNISQLIKKRLSEDGTEAELPGGVVAIKIDGTWIIVSENNLAKNQRVGKK